ncbi:MAG: hypothetical protein ABIH18_02020 [Candidatus Omnitrophota bacterium]
MKKLISVFALSCFLLFISSVYGQGNKFPELKPIINLPKGYELSFKAGPDFYLWYGINESSERLNSKNKEASFGIYFGLHPDLKSRNKKTKKSNGVIANTDITWLDWNEFSGKDILYRREAVFSYSYGRGFLPLNMHVFISGYSKNKVKKLSAIFKDMDFKKIEIPRIDKQ